MKELREKEIAIKYFLGELSGAALESVEEKFFMDPEYSEFMAEVEADLLDEYVRNELSSVQKQKFEEKYLGSERGQNRVKAAAALWEREQINKGVESNWVSTITTMTFWEQIKELFRVPSLIYALSVIIALIIFGGIWFGLRKKEDEIAQVSPTPTPLISPIPITPTISPSNINSGNTNSNNEVKKKENQTNGEKQKIIPEKTPGDEPIIESPKPIIATFILAGGGIRGNDEIQKLKIPQKAQTILLKLTDEQFGKYKKFQIEVENESGKKVLSRVLKIRTPLKTLTIGLTNKTLQNGLHKLTIMGVNETGEVEPVNIYQFSVEKK